MRTNPGPGPGPPLRSKGLSTDDQPRRRFLIVEDEFMIAMILKDYLADIGLDAPWQADNVSDAVDIIINNPDIDGAILDINLRGEPVRPVADALKVRGVPFCFITGYGAGAATGYPEAPILSKPFDMETFQAIIRDLLSGAQRV
jgi:DNA-binding response OmpR family regulator